MIYLNHVILRPLEERDLQQLYGFRNDPEILQGLGGFSAGFSKADLHDWLQFHRQRNDEVLLAISLRETNTCIGHVGLYQIDHRIRKAEIGILIGDRQYQGKGFGKTSTIAMVNYGFQELNLHKVSATVLKTNVRSLNLFRSIGFQEDGILRDEQFRQGEYINMVVLSCLENEWQGIVDQIPEF
jgi:[ribosomal protein S5]-alanine N-acetyltransferase